MDGEPTAVIAPVRAVTPLVPRRRAERIERRQQRERLRRVDRLVEVVADLHDVATVIDAAADRVARGWVQQRWFAPTPVPARADLGADLGPVALRGPDDGGTFTSACLVGAIVLAGGGTRAARSQPVQRAVALTWHSLFRPTEDGMEWCATPHVRLARARDLVHWNDHADRTREDVMGLLTRAGIAARGHLDVARLDLHTA